MLHAIIKKLETIACICITVICFCPDMHADELLHQNNDKTILLNLSNQTSPTANRNSELNLFLSTRYETDNKIEFRHMPSAFEDHSWFLEKEKPKRVSFGTVFKLALDEFGFLSGVKKVVSVTKGKLDNYRKDFYLTGGVVFEKKKNDEPKNPIQELKLQKVNWNFDINPNEKEVLCRFEFGKYFTFTGNFCDDAEFETDVRFDFGEHFKFTGNLGDGAEFAAEVRFDF